MIADIWNPNTWDLTPKACRIYLDERAERFCLVDEIDYQWAQQWCWHANKPHPTRNGKKVYAVRSQGAGGRYKPKLYLHVEIMRRTGILPPSDQHIIVDHLDGDEFNCRRSNLAWATQTMNNRNVRGLILKQATFHVGLDSIP